MVKSSSTKSSKAQYLYVLMMLSLTFALFSQVPLFERKYIFWIVGIVLGVVYARKYLQALYMILFVSYMIVIWLNHMGGDAYYRDIGIVIDEFIMFFIPPTMFYYIIRYNDFKWFYCLFIVFSVFFIETSIVSIFANEQVPGIMRLQSNSVSIKQNAFILMPFKRLGMADYSMPHAIPVLIPGIVAVLRKVEGKIKISFMCVVLLASLGLAYASSSFTALIVTIVSLVLSLLVNKRDAKKTKLHFFIAILIIMPVMASKTIQVSIIQTAEMILPEENSVYKHLIDLEESVMYDSAEGDVESRSIRYMSTYEVILNNFLIGTNEANIGGHSALPDRLAVLGIVGFIPLVLLLGFQIRFTLTYINRMNRYYYYVAIICALIMITFKNMMNWWMFFYLFTLLPGMLYWIGKANKLTLK